MVPNACVPRNTCSSVVPHYLKWKRNSSEPEFAVCTEDLLKAVYTEGSLVEKPGRQSIAAILWTILCKLNVSVIP